MSWNLQKHILDHAQEYVDNTNYQRDFKPSDSKNQHFTCSLDLAQLIVKFGFKTQKEIDEKLKLFMEDLLAFNFTFKESRGVRNGKQRTADVLFNFNDSIVAYHNSASDSVNSQNYNVEPHFHFLFDKKKRIGFGYSALKRAVTEIADKHGLIFHFMEHTPNKANKLLQKNASNLTWFLKRSSDELFIKAVNNNSIDEKIDDFIEAYKKTGNIQYLLKGFVDLQARLKRLRIDYEYKDINIRYEYPLYLSEAQKTTIKELYNGTDIEKRYELLSQRDNKISRAYIEHCMGFKNIIIEETEKRTGYLFPKRDLNIDRIKLKIQKKDSVKKADFSNTLAYCQKKDIETALKYTKNEKEFASMMKKLGYTNFQFKAKTINNTRQRVGFTYTTKNKRKTTVYFKKIALSMQKIRESLKSNSKNESLPNYLEEDLYSHLNNYVPKKQTKNNELFEEIYNLKTQIDLRLFNIIEEEETVEFLSPRIHIKDDKQNKTILSRSESEEEIKISAQLTADIVKAKKMKKILVTTQSSLFIAEIVKNLKDTNIEIVQDT